MTFILWALYWKLLKSVSYWSLTETLMKYILIHRRSPLTLIIVIIGCFFCRYRTTTLTLYFLKMIQVTALSSWQAMMTTLTFTEALTVTWDIWNINAHACEMIVYKKTLWYHIYSSILSFNINHIHYRLFFLWIHNKSTNSLFYISKLLAPLHCHVNSV